MREFVLRGSFRTSSKLVTPRKNPEHEPFQTSANRPAPKQAISTHAKAINTERQRHHPKNKRLLGSLGRTCGRRPSWHSRGDGGRPLFARGAVTHKPREHNLLQGDTTSKKLLLKCFLKQKTPSTALRIQAGIALLPEVETCFASELIRDPAPSP